MLGMQVTQVNMVGYDGWHARINFNGMLEQHDNGPVQIKKYTLRWEQPIKFELRR